MLLAVLGEAPVPHAGYAAAHKYVRHCNISNFSQSVHQAAGARTDGSAAAADALRLVQRGRGHHVDRLPLHHGHRAQPAQLLSTFTVCVDGIRFRTRLTGKRSRSIGRAEV